MGRDIILYLPVLLFSIVLHEYAHGWQARREGDNTAFMLGRLTLNPVPHIDLFGTIVLPLILVLSNSGFLFGWAKPVPVNSRNFREYKKGDIRVSLAGIVVNLALAFICTILLGVTIHVARLAPGLSPAMELVSRMALIGLNLNLILAFFNLIPIPPLDGSHVMYHLLPPKAGMKYREIGQYGMFILMALMIFARPIFGMLLLPAFLLQNLALAFVGLWT